MLKVALFGTSADPPTRGHLAILCWLSQHFDQVAVWASDNPFKSHQTALDHRTEMLRLLIGDLDLRNIQVYPELSSSRTVITVERAQERWQNAEFTLVVGSDLVRQLPKWFRARDLFDRVKLLVVPRPGYSITDSELDPLRQIGADVTIADLNAPNVSSTAYREQGETEGVTSPIQAYIDREQLYRCHARREKLPTY
ncbi:MAG: nicotinate-nucleotide adenylyltransferase [Candidatus Parcubacteria bacterium]|uniref:nicotinate-nucleotide adenylyltransferase n=1 Tax=Phormidesmis priestleyi TaxID=268141 RepID=UPI00083B8509|nr:nicotinate-nucleotide adenylyltransferase [Phormidesmis priestleyi]MBC7823450.1 nicotinate-nucleotide adenylyltransferase [Leptolyngbyaceae cyanobacterium LF-bin-113]